VFEREGVQDSEIIAWVGQRDGVWIHADDRARMQHGKQMLTSGISTLWVHRPRGGMSSADQLRAIIYVLEEYLIIKNESRRPVHYQVAVHGAARRQRVSLTPYTVS